MTQSRREQLRTIQNQLIKVSQAWALGRGFDSGRARELRRQAILMNHVDYFENIPAYRRLAEEEACSEVTDLETVKKKLMSTDDIFKSYRQEWLDARDFNQMNKWLSEIYCSRVEVDVQGLGSIDDWLERLSAAGTYVQYSSGTSGVFSFVPRDRTNRTLMKTANTCYLTPLLTRRKIGTLPGRLLVGPAARLLSPGAFARVINGWGLPDFDAVFLGFRRGRMGNQELMQELAPVFRRRYCLYNIDLQASALRCLRRGARSEEDQKLLGDLRAEVVGRSEENYLRIAGHLKTSTGEGQKIFLFGAPYQFKELCQVMSRGNQKITLKTGSIILFGGGWKSFTGETMSREALVGMLAETFGLPPERIMEGYAMTEINVFMVRCDWGRFHIPPIIEPVVFDDALSPLEGQDLTGTFGFLDPLAVSYPGFIISGDNVCLVDGQCECGLSGPAITKIGRARSREVKGCGGIMGSVKA